VVWRKVGAEEAFSSCQKELAAFDAGAKRTCSSPSAKGACLGVMNSHALADVY